MKAGTTHKTVQPAQVIHEELFQMDRTTSAFECEFILDVPNADSVEQLHRVIYVDRIDNNQKEAHRAANGDFTYDTTARIEPGGEPFDISVVIPHGEARIEGALLKISAKIFELLPTP